jgi:hypothetical protein
MADNDDGLAGTEAFMKLFAPESRPVIAGWLERRAGRGGSDEGLRLPKEWALMSEEERRRFKEEGS